VGFGIPVIMVLDGDFKRRRELYLKHAYDGIELDPEYRERTLENIYYLWDRPTHLETVVDKKSVIYTLGETGHTAAWKD
jgi:stage V sporulation protein R